MWSAMHAYTVKPSPGVCSPELLAHATSLTLTTEHRVLEGNILASSLCKLTWLIRFACASCLLIIMEESAVSTKTTLLSLAWFFCQPDWKEGLLVAVITDMIQQRVLDPLKWFMLHLLPCTGRCFMSTSCCHLEEWADKSKLLHSSLMPNLHLKPGRIPLGLQLDGKEDPCQVINNQSLHLIHAPNMLMKDFHFLLRNQVAPFPAGVRVRKGK